MDPVEPLIRELLGHLGEDPERDGLTRTPHRVAKAWRFLTRGYQEDPKRILGGTAIFQETCEEMVLCRNVDFYSVCEHHLLPFFGRAHIAYIPDGRVIGLSKLARLTEIFARRLQVQERMTRQIAETLMDELRPRGVGVVVEANHLCMVMRGVEKQNARTVTSSLLGEFRDNAATRAEFLSIIGHQIG